jgi:protein involved in polysaccharide export with SLBB domain
MRWATGVVLATVASALAGGCYDAKELNAFLQKPRAPVSAVEYRVLPPDVISITSRHVTEIANVTQQIRPDGRVNLPLLGEIDIAGKTPKEIEDLVKDKAKAFYEEGQVDATVTVTSYSSQRIFVFGQVTTPGPLPWTGRDTLLDVLAKAQPTFLAWPERIIIIRGDEPQTGGAEVQMVKSGEKEFHKTGIRPERVDSPRHTMIVNLNAMIVDGDYSNNILLRPNDVVNVQPNPFAAVGLALQSILFPVRPVLEAVRTPAEVQNAGIAR